MECGIVFIVIFIIAVIWALVSNSQQEGYSYNNLQQAVDRGLTVRCQNDTFTTEDGTHLPITQVTISGVVAVPHTNCPASIRVWMTDSTNVSNSTEEPYAVLCQIQDVATENGVFLLVEEITIPHEVSEVADMGVAAIPSFALVMAHKGEREVEVHVAITAKWDENRLYSYGSTKIWHTQETAGYMEWEAQTREQERQISLLALSVAASTGNVDKRNVAVIRRFFSSRLEGQDDAEERRGEITQQLQEAMATIKSGARQPSELMIDICREIMSGDDDEAFRHTAYELCVEVAAADETVHEQEKEALSFIAAQLSIPPEFIREAHDRNLRLHMYEEADAESLLGMPHGLSLEEKIEFLNKEYTKWRGRATHKDPAIAAEASLRLERITKLRQQLTQQA